MEKVLGVLALAVIAFIVLKHELQIARINRNASSALSEAQKKDPPADAEGKMEYGGLKLP
jgi:hypothetical protein